MSTVDHLCAQLRVQGRRVTPQRRAIIQILLEDDDALHPTADQIFTRVQDVMPDMSHATVYNTLRELVELSILSELDLGLGERHYDITTVNHAHLVCMGCRRIEDVSCDHKALALPPEYAHGFQVVDCRVVYRGYCPVCTS